MWTGFLIVCRWLIVNVAFGGFAPASETVCVVVCLCCSVHTAEAALLRFRLLQTERQIDVRGFRFGVARAMCPPGYLFVRL